MCYMIMDMRGSGAYTLHKTETVPCYLQMSMKSWRTLGLKASKSLKIITTGGCCCSSLAGELRFFPGVPELDF